MRPAWAGPAGPSLATIREVDEDNWETIAMDEKGLMSLEHRAHLRAASRRRFYVQIIISAIFGLAILHVVLFRGLPTGEDAQTKQSNTTVTQLPNVVHVHTTIPAVSSAATTSTPSAPTVTTIRPSSIPTSAAITIPDFPTALQQAISSVPESQTYASLLSAPPASSLLRLTHLRTQVRVYATLLTAFDNLHLSSPSGTRPLHPRLSLPNEISRSLPAARRRDPQFLGETLRGYETFRYLFKQLSESLWPFFRAPVEDLSALRTRLGQGGRGIVMVATDGTAPKVQDAVKELRRQGCALPVEVMYAGSDNLGREARRKLEGLEGAFVTNLASLMPHSTGAWTGDERTVYALALLMSDFREAVLLSPDALPRMPQSLFWDREYIDHGALFVNARDGWKGGGDPMRTDMGVVVVDKVRHFVPLLTAIKLSGEKWAMGEEVSRAHGLDKKALRSSVFRLAFETAAEEKFRFFV